MKTPGVVILSRGQVSSLLTIRECIDVVEDAFRMHAQGNGLEPCLLHVDSKDGEFHIRAGGLKLDRTYFCVKIGAGFFGNMERFGLPNIQGVLALFDGDTGSPLAVMDAIEITIQRTGAVAAVAAKYLARPESSVVTICGCGNQGRIQLKALKQVLPAIKQAFAFDVNEQAAIRYAAEMSKELDIVVEAESDVAKAVARSDVVVTCTPSSHYYLRRDYVTEGTFVAAIGADSPHKQELEPSLLMRSKLVVDILEQCARAGELHHALEAGLLTRQNVHGELGDVIAGKIPGRSSEEEITIFDATGTALQDVAAAAAVYRRAVAEGVGLVLQLSD
jgi:ornithine cyclodeaminase/alanine dehydrogenase